MDIKEALRILGIEYPAGVRNHRLYVCDKDGKSLGYLSFNLYIEGV